MGNLISESGPLDSMDQSTANALFPLAKDSQEDVLPKRDSEAFDYLLTDMCQCFGEKKTAARQLASLPLLTWLNDVESFSQKQDCQTW